MSVQSSCQVYRSLSNNNWKHALGDIIMALEVENHPDYQIFSTAACTLMMKDKPGYWWWLDTTITKLINDPISRLDPLPDLLDYDEMSTKELLDKYELNDKNYRHEDILTELKYRYPQLIQSNEIEPIFNLREKLKDVI